jgi:hypothetical protein
MDLAEHESCSPLQLMTETEPAYETLKITYKAQINNRIYELAHARESTWRAVWKPCRSGEWLRYERRHLVMEECSADRLCVRIQ